ncbi:MAG TPA: TIGR03915 family putative DNA repair protein, partial [Geobacteraceae bacterium]|nr:TIGR03915 family putative DNA repair protein [Geobacteraceae bacterium]
MGGMYRYDGTFAGLLTVIGRILPEHIIPAAISVGPPLQQTLFDEVTTVETDPKLVEEFSGLLAKHLTPSCCNRIRLVFLADHPEREMMICRYIILALELGGRISAMLAHPHVAPLWKLAQQVGREAHRYQGFVRFRETSGGFYYAAISPDHRVLPLIAPHFASRFSDQQWVIH